MQCPGPYCCGALQPVSSISGMTDTHLYSCFPTGILFLLFIYSFSLRRIYFVHLLMAYYFRTLFLKPPCKQRANPHIHQQQQQQEKEGKKSIFLLSKYKHFIILAFRRVFESHPAVLTIYSGSFLGESLLVELWALYLKTGIKLESTVCMASALPLCYLSNHMLLKLLLCTIMLLPADLRIRIIVVEHLPCRHEAKSLVTSTSPHAEYDPASIAV